MAGWSMRSLGARCTAPAREVRGRVVRPEVGLSLAQPATDAEAIELPYQELAQHGARDGERVAIEEVGAEHGAVVSRDCVAGAPEDGYFLIQKRPARPGFQPSCGSRGGAAWPRT